MQIDHARARAPDQLPTLQRISDQVWMKLSASGNFIGPTDPETMHGKIARRVMRYEIGRQVMSYADHHHMTDREITRAIVDRMSITYGSAPRARPRRRRSSVLDRHPVTEKGLALPRKSSGTRQ